MDSREEIARFMDVTGSKDESEALQFLQRSAFNLEKAVNAYFRRQTTRLPVTGASTSHASIENGIDPASVVEGSVKLMAMKRRKPPNDPVISIDDGEEEDISKIGEDGVRAPIPPIRDTIVRQTFRQTYGGQRAASQHSTLGGGNSNVFEQFHDFQKLSEEQKARLAKRARLERTSFEDGDNNGGAAMPTPSSSALEMPRPADTSSRLQSLFRPPIDLLFGGDWDEALAESRRTSRWLLVNIQMAEEFSCQVLNRDVWSDSTVRDIVKSNFLLWQVYHNSPDGARVRGYYAVHSFPAIFIVDPRTGEKVLSMRDGDRAAFLESLTSFLDQYPNFEATDRRDRPHVGANGASRLKRKGSPKAESSSDGGVEVERKRMRRLVTIEDGEGLERAGGVGQTDDHTDPDEWKKHVQQQGESDEQIEVVLRLPDGRRETIPIFRSTKLLALILRAVAAGFDMKVHRIVLNHPKRVFTMGDTDKTADEMGFNRQEVVYLEKIRINKFETLQAQAEEMQHHVNDLMKSHLVNYSIEPNCRPCRVYELSLEKEDVIQPLLRGQVKMAYDEREKSYMCLLIDKATDREIEYISYSFRIDSNLFWAQLKSKPAVCTFRNKAYISDKTPKDVIYAMKFESDEAASEFCDKLDEVLKETGVTLARPNNRPKTKKKKKTKKREDSTRLDRQ